MIKRATVDLWAGIWICLTLAALIPAMYGGGVLSGGNPRASYEIESRFTNIGGLKVGAPVRSAGVVVGRVDEIRFDNEAFEAVVTLAIDERFSFPIDTSASVLTSGVLGEGYVHLDAGTQALTLRPGGVIAHTRSAVVIEEMVGRFLFPDKRPQGSAARPGRGSEAGNPAASGRSK